MSKLFKILIRILLLFGFILLTPKDYVTGQYKLTAIFYGNSGFDIYQVNNLTSWLGKRPAIVVLYTSWCSSTIDVLFNTQLMNIWTSGSIPLATWELFPCYGNTLPGITKLIYNGTYDTYINQFTDNLKTWLSGNDGVYGNGDDRRLYLRFAHEMNGNWYPWSQNATPTDYVLAWQYVYNVFVNKGLNSTRVQWIWCPNSGDLGDYTAEQYWVGDNYTDWIGIDGYNWGTSQWWSSWVTPSQVFDNMVGRLRNLTSTKPLCFPEYGTSSIYSGNVSNVSQKTNWLNQVCTYINKTQVKMASYFNQDKELDAAIFGGIHGNAVWRNVSVYTAYKSCFQSKGWITPNSSNPRLITDDQFAGRI